MFWALPARDEQDRKWSCRPVSWLLLLQACSFAKQGPSEGEPPVWCYVVVFLLSAVAPETTLLESDSEFTFSCFSQTPNNKRHEGTFSC